MSRRNARTTMFACRLIVERRLAGWLAEQLGVFRAIVSTWIARYRAEGWAGLEDRFSRPHTIADRTAPALEAQILTLRTDICRGADYLAGEVGLPASTARYRGGRGQRSGVPGRGRIRWAGR